ncbi:MAG: 4'-phosphopantetheinyl transferase superfamily protein, partial [Eubacteriales bacterium]|nr:4'-phosphopantetheinyl transferase superfamily protein [Eubacteriales bacterium]
GPCFNLSHAGSLVVLGIGDAELGIDVERAGRKLSDSVLRCLTPEERSWLEKVRPEDPTAFFRLWTAKESIMKATGLGLQLSPRSFHVLPVADGLHNILEQDWHLYWRSPAEDYILCAASREPSPPSLNFFSARELLL